MLVANVKCVCIENDLFLCVKFFFRCLDLTCGPHSFMPEGHVLQRPKEL